jgi:hypothetical protein
MLKTKADGWALFCERRNFDPSFLWTDLPGYPRLKYALERAGKCAYSPSGMASWMYAHFRDDGPETTEADLMSADSFADETETLFRGRVEWWRG